MIGSNNITRGPRIRSARQGREPREFTHSDAVAMGDRIRKAYILTVLQSMREWADAREADNK